jgi:hypothetical protein
MAATATTASAIHPLRLRTSASGNRNKPIAKAKRERCAFCTAATVLGVCTEIATAVVAVAVVKVTGEGTVQV